MYVLIENTNNFFKSLGHITLFGFIDNRKVIYTIFSKLSFIIKLKMIF